MATNFKIENNILKSCDCICDEKETKYLDDFLSCLSEVVVPNGVKVIGKDAFFVEDELFYSFNTNNDIGGIILPDSVTEIKEGAFKYCNNLKTVKLSRNLEKISESAFEGDSYLESIEIDESNPYYSCAYGVLYNKNHRVLLKAPGASDFRISNKVQKLGPYSFEGSWFKSNITIPDNIKFIGKKAFANSSGVKFLRVKISNNVEVLDDDVFSSCRSIKEVIMPKNLKEIKNGAFKDCIRLSSIELPSTLKKIAENAFFNCSSLKSIKIPSGVEEINSNTFGECKRLESVEIEEGVKVIKTNAFDGCDSLKHIYIPSTVEEIEKDAFPFSAFCIETIEISLENKKFYAKDCKIFNKENGKCIFCSGNNSKKVPVNKDILTSSVVMLPEGTDGSCGKNGRYVLFGDWPQSLKEDDVKIDSTCGCKYIINGFECFKGSDNAYYVQQKALENTDISDALFDERDPVNFDNEEEIIRGEIYYFKMESIKWRILTDDYQGKKLLAVENLLEPYSFFDGDEDFEMGTEEDDDIIYPNNYEYSDIRKYLNSDFITKAFTPEAAAKLLTVNVSNGEESTTDKDNNIEKACDYICNDTKDKVFLLSENEVTNPLYGFSPWDKKGTESERSLHTTEYARCLGISSIENAKYNNTSMWWLRTPDKEDSDCSLCVGFGGSAVGGKYLTSYTDIGYVAAISVDF